MPDDSLTDLRLMILENLCIELAGRVAVLEAELFNLRSEDRPGRAVGDSAPGRFDSADTLPR